DIATGTTETIEITIAAWGHGNERSEVDVIEAFSAALQSIQLLLFQFVCGLLRRLLRVVTRMIWVKRGITPTNWARVAGIRLPRPTTVSPSYAFIAGLCPLQTEWIKEINGIVYDIRI